MANGPGLEAIRVSSRDPPTGELERRRCGRLDIPPGPARLPGSRRSQAALSAAARKRRGDRPRTLRSRTRSSGKAGRLSRSWPPSARPLEAAFRTGVLLQGRYQIERELGQGGMGRVYLRETRGWIGLSPSRSACSGQDRGLNREQIDELRRSFAEEVR